MSEKVPLRDLYWPGGTMEEEFDLAAECREHHQALGQCPECLHPHEEDEECPD